MILFLLVDDTLAHPPIAVVLKHFALDFLADPILPGGVSGKNVPSCTAVCFFNSSEAAPVISTMESCWEWNCACAVAGAS